VVKNILVYNFVKGNHVFYVSYFYVDRIGKNRLRKTSGQIGESVLCGRSFSMEIEDSMAFSQSQDTLLHT